MTLQSIKWVWSLSFGGVVWVVFSFVAMVPEALPEKLESMHAPIAKIARDYLYTCDALKS